MNERTKDDLIKFVNEVMNFCVSVSSISGTGALEGLIDKGENLIKSLKTDETLP